MNKQYFSGNENLEVLIVDDCHNTVSALRRLFRKRGVDVAVAYGGQEGLDLALEKWSQGQIFDAIIMDINMPKMDGYSAASYLRLKEYPGIIISLTGEAKLTSKSESKEAGINGFLTKPTSIESILKSIATCALEDEPRTRILF